MIMGNGKRVRSGMLRDCGKQNGLCLWAMGSACELVCAGTVGSRMGYGYGQWEAHASKHTLGSTENGVGGKNTWAMEWGMHIGNGGCSGTVGSRMGYGCGQ